MNDELTRREVLKGLAAVSLSGTALSAEPKSEPICFMSAVEMAGLIRAKKLSAREALAEHMRQIERVNAKVNAIVTLVPEMAAEAAAKADEMQAHNEKLGTAPRAARCAQRPAGDAWHTDNVRVAVVQGFRSD
jgi:amidase